MTKIKKKVKREKELEKLRSKAHGKISRSFNSQGHSPKNSYLSKNNDTPNVLSVIPSEDLMVDNSNIVRHKNNTEVLEFWRKIKGVDLKIDNTSQVMNSLNDFKTDEPLSRNTELYNELNNLPKQVICAKKVSQIEVKGIQNKYKENLGLVDEIQEDHEVVRYKGNFIIQKVQAKRKDLTASANVRKNTSPNLKPTNSSQNYRYLKNIASKKHEFFDLNRFDEVVGEDNLIKRKNLQKLQSSKRNIGDDTQDDGLDSALVILKYNNNEDKFGSEKYKMYEAYCNS